ncbi:hypothetical protein QAD02_008632 [Eretmocerus hayati]|uniref:Uncharacterized protein n=1 Tax=Eretmocerus hayati TaxID=131215 RepID=A0ACC2N6Z9_9HYME|nr:hypothetical protein QAD02_008632 [Eretmocerus hayati]
MMEQKFMSAESVRIAQFLDQIEKSPNSFNCGKTVLGGVKNAEKSNTLRKAANDVRSRNSQRLNTLRVLKLYSQSVATAPLYSEEMSLALYARSDFSFQLCLFSECIKDLDQILTLGCSDNLKSKVSNRKAECYLQSCSDVKKTNIEDTIGKMNIELDDELETSSIEKLKNSGIPLAEGDSPKNDQGFDISDEPLLISYQQEIPCASETVGIEFDNQYGRKVIATKNIKPGDILAVEKMYCFALDPSAFYSHCSHCAKVAWASLPCNHCLYSVYCSDECRDTAWNEYHEIECKVLSHLIDKYEECDKYRMVLTVRIMLKAVNENKGDISKLKENLEKIDNAPDQCKRGFSENGKLLNNYKSVLSLGSNAYKRDTCDLIKVSRLSSEVLYCLITLTNLFEKSKNKDEDIIFIGALTSRVYHTILYNQFSMMENQDVTPRRAYMFSSDGMDMLSLLSGFNCQSWSEIDSLVPSTNYSDLGSLISPFCSLVNHSCFPNVATCLTANGELILYSLSCIKEKSQLFICYKDLCSQTRKSTRQYIMKLLSFDCDCTPCREDWPLLYEAQPLKNKTKDASVLKLVSEIYELRRNSKSKEKMMKRMVEEALEVIIDKSLFPTKEFYELTDMLLHLFVVLYGKWFQVPAPDLH